MKTRLIVAALISLAPMLTVVVPPGSPVEARASGPKAPPCPLTDAQTRKSIAAFEPIAKFVTSEPRCFNCHGGVNPYLDGPGLDPKDPTAPASVSDHFIRLDHKKPDGEIDFQCKECHNNMAKRRDGSPSLWMTAVGAHAFVDKDATTLCRQFKRSTGTAEAFLAHIKDDEGGDNFSGTAFNGDRGLDPVEFHGIPAEPPSISHDAVMKLAQDWINAMGGSFQGDESCGCELKHARWSGQIYFMTQTTGDEWHDEQNNHDGYSSTRITVTVSDGVGTYHGHVEQQYQAEGRQGYAVGNGRVAFRNESSDSIEGSGDGTFPATVEVNVNEDKGVYDIKVGGTETWSVNGKAKAIGTTRSVRCFRNKCTSNESDIGMPGLPPMGPLGGTLKDRDHIDETLTVKKGELGLARNATKIDTMTVHLWRSSSN
jgi:osmotically-inducible protein OsmY